MAWLSGLADKAENLLNKIDQNTAAVLNKDKYDVPLPRVVEGTWVQNGFTNDTMDVPSTQTTLHCASAQQITNLETTIPTHEQWEKISEHRCCPSILPDHLNISLRDEEGGFTDNNKYDPFMEEKDNIMESWHKHKLEKQEAEDNAAKMPFATSSEHKSTQKSPVATETELEEPNIASGTQETDHQKQIICLKEKLTAVEMEKSQLLTQITDLMSMLEKSRLEVNTMQSELELHRARALKTLREKEKLITELRRNTIKDTDDIIVMELNQIRQEREVLREENQLICEQLRIAREELITADLKLEEMKHKIKEASVQAQDVLAVEKRKRLDAEEDARLHSEEIRSLKEELIRQRNSFTLQLRKQESELSRLRIQLSATTTPSSEVESRLATLTQTLVLKQQALEHLTTERNALRFQMEKIEHEYRNYVGNSRRNVPYNNGNDTDDAKAQIPLFLIETPFDTSVTRRVKRAYSSLDAISIRTGVFLRRYPLARILVLIYMALLQFWVLIVLLSQSPDAH